MRRLLKDGGSLRLTGRPGAQMIWQRAARRLSFGFQVARSPCGAVIALASPYRSTSFTRALYQFMNAEMQSEIIR